MGPALTYVLLAGALAMPGGPRHAKRFMQPLGFPLVVTSVSEIQKKWGLAVVRETGHAEETVCYVWPDSRALVWFTSDREGIAGEFRVKQLAEHSSPNCTRLAGGTVAGVALDVSGLHLGMSRKQFAKTLGGGLTRLPDGQEGAEFEWSEAVDRKRMPDVAADEWYTTVSVAGRFMEDRLIDLSIRVTMST